MTRPLVVLLGALILMQPAHGTTAPALTFTNPVVRSQDAPDPWVIRHGGRYYLTSTFDQDGGLWVWSAATLTGLDAGRKVKVWTAPASGPLSQQVWAPELHFLRGRWYLYFTASDGVDANHRHYVLEAETGDPQGPYKPPVRVDPALDSYAIDGSVLQLPDGRLYWMYAADGVWIAPMDSPTHVRDERVPFILGTEDWEHVWVERDGAYVREAGYWVEAPEALLHAGRTFVAYSAGHTAAKYYLGLMELRGQDPMDPSAWVKHKGPLFGPYEGPDGAVYAPGHNSFTTSPDGREDWLVYHAKEFDWPTFDGRTMRAQKFTWGQDGLPVFGHPVPSGVVLPRPSGEVPH
ncbi:hypothetical protein DAETH_38890 (plasmid) [Deinococcus aetherius]|uniref:Alpha-N-arabinofuranosidase n=1 Tax=Deinococcus aetherius TaxID=200252 RepID=A0ABM8AJP8_9DEIO|nr:glycoside hydrolase family 43 protein [Deinococcus aetherius]BDP43920.1 hypothetical protein DAETH_38890 [Deinococcus aetherius]